MSPARREMAIASVALLIVGLVGSLVFIGFGKSPIEIWGAMAGRSIGDSHGIGEVLYRATGLLLTGLAVAIALDVGLFNIGVEGQMAAGIFAAGVVGAALPADTPAVLAVAACMTAAAAAGATLGALTGALRVWRGAHEVITGIMLNAVVAGVLLWLCNEVVFVPGTARGPTIAASAELPHLGLGQSPASMALLLALAIAGIVYLVRSHSAWGLTLRNLGDGPSATEALGHSVRTWRIAVMAVSGGLAGLVALSVLLGNKHAVEEGLGRGIGYYGIAVALLGRRHPLGVVAAALAVAFVSYGGLAVGDRVPKETTELLLGVLVLAIACAPYLVLRWQRDPRSPHMLGGQGGAT